MDCPICRQAMIVLETEQVEVDYCAACGGIWLDEGELELLLEDAAGAYIMLQSFTSAHTNEEKRKCPICRKKMEKINAGQSEGRTELLDRCPNHHGLWFDRGELQRILQTAHFDNEGKVKHLLGELFFSDSECKE